MSDADTLRATIGKPWVSTLADIYHKNHAHQHKNECRYNFIHFRLFGLFFFQLLEWYQLMNWLLIQASCVLLFEILEFKLVFFFTFFFQQMCFFTSLIHIIHTTWRNSCRFQGLHVQMYFWLAKNSIGFFFGKIVLFTWQNICKCKPISIYESINWLITRSL